MTARYVVCNSDILITAINNSDPVFEFYISAIHIDVRISAYWLPVTTAEFYDI